MSIFMSIRRSFYLAIIFTFLSGISVYALEGERCSVFPSIIITAPEDLLVDRETWFEGTVEIYDPRNGEWSMEAVAAEVRGRGNSTWRYGGEKRPLRFRFAEPTSVMHFEHEARTWVTFADHFDPSLLRNYLVFSFAASLENFSWTPVVQKVHMYVNGDYLGIYTLSDERDIGESRANITLDSDPAVSEYMLERDRRTGRAASGSVEGLDHVRVNGVVYDIRFPSGRRTSEAHAAYVNDFMHRVSESIRSGCWDAITSIICVPAMVDFYIVQEWSRNPDSGFSSIFMQIMGQGEDRRLVMGPVWDFDIAAGLATGARPNNLLAATRNYWFNYLLRVPEFQEALTDRWQEIRDIQITQVLDSIMEFATEYEEVFNRNFERHPVLGTSVWRNTHATVLEIDTFLGQVEHLVDFLIRRAEWLDGFFERGVFEPNLNDRDFSLE
ncbi:MAG: CotH kinase family protein [Defluviitaleaceae bacterium]|nr:CotH kinase family protein [Defluviitaleaceae bacterium]